MTYNRRIIVAIATGADAFLARLDGSVDWLGRPRPKGNYGMAAFYNSINTILWGRETFDMTIDFQKGGVPGSAFDPNRSSVPSFSGLGGKSKFLLGARCSVRMDLRLVK